MSSGAYTKVAVRVAPQGTLRETAENRYWKKFKNVTHPREIGPATSVSFSPAAPHAYAITASTRVSVYNAASHRRDQQITRFQDVAYSASFRSDGQLLVVGGEEGLLRVFKVGKRAILRQFRTNSGGAVRVARFSADRVHVLSGADDGVVRVWDMAAEKQLARLRGHSDSIRAGAVSAAMPDLFFTAAYDHTVRVWDLRQRTCVHTWNHGAPVEDVAVFPTGTTLATVGGPTLHVWDLLKGGGSAPLAEASNHRKTVTSVCVDGTGARLLTGSLDHTIKVHETASFTVAHAMSAAAPILALGVSPDNVNLVVCMSTGAVNVRERPVRTQDVVAERAAAPAHTRKLFSGTYAYYSRGHTHKGDEGDLRVESARKQRLAAYDKALRRFEYAEALDAALAARRVEVIVGVLEELVLRGGLEVAIQNRAGDRLHSLLAFLTKHVSHALYAATLTHVANVTLDLHAAAMGRDAQADALWQQLRQRVGGEVRVLRDMQRLRGALDMLLASSS